MRYALPFLLLLALLLAVAAYDRSAPRADFVLTQAADTFTLDPQRASWMQDLRTLGALYEGLVRKNPYTGAVEPGVAERWECSPEGLSWTFHLRPNARWSDGSPVTAQDFVYAWRRAMLPDSASDYSGFFFEIAGGEEFFQWRSAAMAQYAKDAAAGKGGTPAAAAALWRQTEEAFDRMVKLKAVDDHTLQFTLRRPVPYWLDLAAFAVMVPVHRATHQAHTHLEAATGRVLDDPQWTKAGTSVTNGPFLLADWRYKRVLRLERNPHYWDPTAPRVQSVDILPIEDNNTAVLAFMAGSVDWVSDVRVGYRAELVAQMERYCKRHRAQLDALLAKGLSMDEALAQLPPPEQGERRDVHVLPAFGTDFFSFNCRPELPGGRFNPFKDARVRRAFAMAVDRQLLCDRVLRAGDVPATTIVPVGSIPGYSSPKGLGFDPVRARAELAAAGWTDRNGDGMVEDAEGRPFPTVDLLYSTGNERYRDLSLAMADMWRQHLGVPVEPRSKDAKFYKDDVKSGDYMIARGAWYGDFQDPVTFLDISRSTDGNNDRKFNCPAYDALLDRAALERDPAKRLTTLAEAERLLVEEEMPLLLLARLTSIYMYDPATIRGLTREPPLDQKLGLVERISPSH